MSQRIVLDIGRTQALATLLATLLGLAGTVWGATKWAVRGEVDRAVEERFKVYEAAEQERFRTFATRADVDAMKGLSDLRLVGFEKQLDRIDEAVSFLYQREMERSGRRGSERTGG